MGQGKGYARQSALERIGNRIGTPEVLDSLWIERDAGVVQFDPQSDFAQHALLDGFFSLSLCCFRHGISSRL
jgi:hypothetical protein